MKVLISLVRIIIAIYLSAFIIVSLLLYSQKKAGNSYPNIAGYSYYVVEDDRLLPEYPKDTFVVVYNGPDTYNFNENDYVLLKEKELTTLRKVVQKHLDEEHLDQFVAGYTNADESENVTAPKSNVLAISIYHSQWLTVCYQILTNWLVIVILVLFLVLSSSVTFKRFEL